MVLRFDPFTPFNRLAERLWTDDPGQVSGIAPIDVFRSGDHYVVHCDLPGVDPGSVDVSIAGTTLTIRARRTARSGDDLRWLTQERPTGRIVRRLVLGTDLDAEHTSATYDDGVLTITIPVAEEARPRHITVAAGQPEGRILHGTATEAPAVGQAPA